MGLSIESIVIKNVREKSALKADLDKTTAALQTLGEKTDELLASFEKVKAERDLKASIIEDLGVKLQVTT